MWHKSSWRTKPIQQKITYKNQAQLKIVENELSLLPPLVFAKEVQNLKDELKKATLGEAFLLQGGDCAESFSHFNASNIRDFLKIFLQMAAVLTYAGSLPVVKVARIAGQFAKPRSSEFEEKDGVCLPSYRGDIINEIDFNALSREPNPLKMIQAYHQSASTHNLLRAFSNGGLADLNEISKWNLDFTKDFDKKFETIAFKIQESLNFMKACGINVQNTPQLNEIKLYTSHEALLLNYEEALTRQDSLSGGWYDCSAHFLWIGDRTKSINEAHVEFLKGVKNPIGVKVGADADVDKLLKLCDILNLQNETGRLNFIIRMGADLIEKKFPPILKKLEENGKKILYSIDPMHANTIKSSTNYKTRKFDDIMKETCLFFDIHKSFGTHAGGIHLEMTGENVTECIGGSMKIKEEDLNLRYHTHCDPRLNASQALELAFMVADYLKKEKK